MLQGVIHLLREVDILVLFPVVATIIGGVWAALRPPAPWLRSAIQYLAAGVGFAAVSSALLPEIVGGRQPLPVVVGFAAGVAVALVVRRVMRPVATRAARTGRRRGLLITAGIDSAAVGLLVGIGLAAGEETGTLLVIALTLEALFLGLATAAALEQAGAPRERVVGIMVGLAAVLVLAAGAGILLLDGLAGTPRVTVLAFGAAALLCLIMDDLLAGARETRETRETRALVAIFLVGFLALLMIQMVM